MGEKLKDLLRISYEALGLEYYEAADELHIPRDRFLKIVEGEVDATFEEVCRIDKSSFASNDGYFKYLMYQTRIKD